MSEPRVAIAATFTAQLLGPVLEMWMRKLDEALPLVWAPQGQVFQPLLEPNGLLRTNRGGVSVVLVRRAELGSDVARAARDLRDALVSSAEASSSPHVVVVCPSDEDDAADIALASALGGSAGVDVVPAAEIARLYPTVTTFDAFAEREAQVPFTEEKLAAIGTVVARRIRAARTTPKKVILLDCDDTLWGGLCGELGPAGVVLDAPRLALQRFVLAQREQGVLLAVVSRNNEKDALDVFERRAEMLLRREHLTTFRINWGPKSENIHDIARELGLGVDSFVFFDDDAFVCAEAREGCPGLVVVQLPEDLAHFDRFLASLWIFDRGQVTAEDRKRAEGYRAESERKALRDTLGAEQFFASLELAIELTEMREDDVARVSQMFQRTNQFNATGARRSEAEVRAFAGAGFTTYVVRVRDRFGDYGLTGVVVVTARDRDLVVESFLLSCRVLGRGVEQALARELGRMATARGAKHVVFPYVATPKNAPYADFYESLPAPRAPVQALVELRYGGADPRARKADGEAKKETAPLRRSDAMDHRAVALTLATADAIAVACRAVHAGGAPAASTEERVAAIWREVLDLPSVAHDADLFDIGGDSLAAVRVLTRLKAELHTEIPLHELFAATATVAWMAERVAPPEGAPAPEPPPVRAAIPHVARDGGLVTSFAQERLWFLVQLAPDAAAYLVPRVLRLRGVLDVGALRHAVSEIVGRHEILRTTFVDDGGEPRQVVSADRRATIAVEDVTGEEAARARALELVGEPFDIVEGPLVRAHLLRLASDLHMFVVVMHHLVTDGWSTAVFERELRELYDARVRGRRAELPVLALHYADYAAWQRGAVTEAPKELVRYWEEHLRGAPEYLNLPLDRPRPAERRYRGAFVVVDVGASARDRVAELARSLGATPFMIMLATFDLLLAEESGQSDVVVGVTIANRPRRELEDLIGLFVNTLPVRVTLEPRASFSAVVAKVKAAVAGAFEHQDVPFERIVEAVSPRRTANRTPIFQVAFSHVSRTDAGLALEGVEVAYETPYVGATFDLSLFVEERPNAMRVTIEYDVDLFDPATIDRFAKGFARTLDAAARAPDAPRAADHVSTREPTEPAPRRDDRCLDVVARIAAQARETPRALAVTDGATSLDYAELEARAGRFARVLVDRGIGPEHRVATYFERSTEMIVAQLAIMKAGAAFVPLDPKDPKARRDAVLADARASLVVARADVDLGVEVLSVDAAPEGGGASPRVSPIHPRQAAYVIYTSGTTGQPKGVVIEHGALANVLVAKARQRALPLGARVSQIAAAGFDASITEIWPTLASGASLYIVGDELKRSPRELVAYLAENRITCAYAPTALAEVLFEEDWSAVEVRRFEVGGQALVKRAPPTARFELWNIYGPTETTVEATVGRVDAAGRGLPHIGRPIDDVSVYVLDRDGGPCPVGVAGELAVGGAGVARGYLGAPERSAEKFVPDPFAREPGARMYRTGDLASWREDGALDYLGRVDRQVKMRGFRIELGEIEASLVSLPAIASAVVVPWDAPRGDRILVAYVVPAARVAQEPGELRAALSEALPEYMVPAAFVALDALPLTLNGKVDLRALPPPDEAGFGSRSEPYAAPRDAREELLATVFAAVLGVDRVGVDDDFFALGGHSLLATRVVSRVRSALGVELSVRALFDAPTVAGLAARVRRAEASARDAQTALVAVDRTEPVPASFAQSRLWFLEQLEGPSATYNVRSATRLVGQLDAGALERALAALVVRHPSLRTTFRDGDAAVEQIVHPAGTLPLSRAEASPEGEAAWLAAETSKPFDLSRGPLARASLLRVSEREHVFALTIHHIVTDGWSSRILNRDLSRLYAAALEGKTARPEARAIDYPEYAAWQKAWLSPERLAAQLAFWKEHLAAAPAALELPTDRPRPPHKQYRGGSVALALTPKTVRSLRALCRRLSVTPFMVLLTGFQALLSRWSGQDDVVVGTPIANRTREELEEVVGFFVNTLPFRSSFERGDSFAGALERTKSVALSAYAHQDLPFEKLVEELAVPRDMSRHPVFQVMFALQNVEPTSLELRGVSSERAPLPASVEKFDLTFTLFEEKDTFGGTLSFDVALFDEGTIETLAQSFLTLLEGAVVAPETPIAALPLLGDDERRTLLTRWNATDHELRTSRLVHEQFEDQADRTPGAIALELDEARLTYRELDDRANRVANELLRRGVRIGDVVVLCLERSLEMVVAVYAVLKVGAAYAPLDPEHPPQRLATLIDDVGPSAVLVRRATRPLVPDDDRVLCLDDDREIDVASRARPALALAPETSAYVLYTSGSTGMPKAVVNTHAGIQNRLAWMQAEYRLTAEDAVLQKTPYTFDVSVWELLWPLLVGARLVLAQPGGHKDPLYLSDAVRDHRITTLHFVPSMLDAFLRYGDTTKTTPLRRVLCSGEALSPDLVRRFFEAIPCELHNLYGPTEAAIDVTSWACRRDETRDLVPIGRPIWNTQLYVLASDLSPVPRGAAGELYIGGANVASGYRKRPSLTAERFVPDPFSSTSGRTMYRTGDLARWLPDGSLQYLGRIDNQVKLRGQRIELGEIESTLAGCVGVANAVVVVREVAPGDTRLVGYVVPATGHELGAASLKAALAKTLPEYMVPSAFVVLEKLPLTSSGKVDRRALPEPDLAPPPLDEDDEGPQTPLEELVASVFAKVLRVDGVGRRGDFFALGGHSMLAMRVVTLLHAAGAATVRVRDLFEAPTVVELAARLACPTERPAVPPIRPTSDAAGLVPSFVQEMMISFEAERAPSRIWTVVQPIELHGPLDDDRMIAAIRAMLVRQESLRHTFDSRALGFAQKLCSADDVAIEQVTIEDDEAWRRLLEQEASHAFLIRGEPLVRFKLARRAAERHDLVVTWHHAVNDPNASALLQRNLVEHYALLGEDRSARLPPLPLRYVDYARWEREWFLRGHGADEVRRVQERLAGASPLRLADRPADSPVEPAAIEVPFELDSTATQAFLQHLRDAPVTPFIGMCAVLAAHLARWAGQTDVVFLSPLNLRNLLPELALVTGRLLNMVAVRISLAGDPTWSELLARARLQVTEAFSFERAPASLVLGSSAVHSHPLARVVFNMPSTAGTVSLPPPRSEGALNARLASSRSPAGARGDLAVVASIWNGRLSGFVRGAKDRFDDATITRESARLRDLLLSFAPNARALVD